MKMMKMKALMIKWMIGCILIQGFCND